MISPKSGATLQGRRCRGRALRRTPRERRAGQGDGENEEALGAATPTLGGSPHQDERQAGRQEAEAGVTC